jgi:hypothetical protein
VQRGVSVLPGFERQSGPGFRLGGEIVRGHQVTPGCRL